MENGKQPAFAVSKEMCEMPNGKVNIEEYPYGLTKREYFASTALQGLMTTLIPLDNNRSCPDIDNVKYCVNMAVTAADELLSALEKANCFITCYTLARYSKLKYNTMEKTAMAQLIDWMNTPAMSLNDGKSVIQKSNELLIVEKEQMCKMYVQGRKDNHLDYYPEKHAKETYEEFFIHKI